MVDVVVWSFMSSHIIPRFKLADAKTLDVGDSAAGPLPREISPGATEAGSGILPYASVVD